MGGGVVVELSSLLLKYKKHLEKHKNNEEKTMKIYFYCSQRNGFSEYKKQKYTPFPKQVFCVFCFQEQKTVLENRNQTSLDFSAI